MPKKNSPKHVSDANGTCRADECSNIYSNPPKIAADVSGHDWEAIFQAIGSPTVILDTDFRILHANLATVNATGKSAEELYGKKCFQVFHDAKSNHSAKGCPMEKMLKTSAVQHNEMEVETLGGTYLVSCTPVFDEQHKVKKIIHIATPISEQKRITRELELQNKYLEQLNQFTIELGRLSPKENVERFITKQLRSLSGGIAVTLSTYDQAKKCVYIKQFEADSWIISKVNQLLGRKADQIASPIEDDVYEDIIQNQVGLKKTLHESSFGAVTPMVSAAIGKLIGADRYIGLAYVCDNRLYGTSLIPMRKGSVDPPPEILRTFGHLAALAMQRKQAIEALKESEEKYRLLIETMTEGVVLVDNNDVVQFINPAACKIYGYSEADLLGKTGYKSLVIEEDWHIIQDKNSIRELGIIDSYLVRGRKVTGELIWLRISGAPILDRLGIVVGSVGILTDITASKQIEDTLRLQNAYLDELIEGAAEAIVVLDNDDIVRRINKEFTTIFEYSPEEAVGRKINDLIVPPDLNEEGWQATSNVTGGNQVNFETVRVSKSGKRIPVSVLGNPIKLEGKQFGVYAIYRDISRRLKLENQLRQSQRLDSIGQLAGGVAHDFNNMLTVILGYGDELLATLGANNTHRREIEEIINAGQRAMNLTNQLLAFSRKQLIHPKVLNLNDVINDMSMMLHRLITEDITIETNLAPNLHLIKADTSQVEQIILNLTVNARDAMPRGGRLSIKTSNFKVSEQTIANVDNVIPGDYIELSFSDTGIGMNEETLNRLFEPFYSTKDKSSSSGLGLATVYGIVKQSGGYIWVYSEPGLGSTFTILLPRSLEAQKSETRVFSKPTSMGSGQQILIVEDEDLLRALVAKIVSKLGYEVTAVADGQAALEKIKSEDLHPDLVITDVIMPGMNGKELADILKKDRPELKILFMSGYTETIIAQHGVLDKDIPFIQKPFSRNQIADKIAELLPAVNAELEENATDIINRTGDK